MRHLGLQDATHPNKFIGETVWASKEFGGAPEEIIIKNVAGCAGFGKMTEAERSRLLRTFEINGTHFCSMFSFYMQLMDGRLPTAEEEADFDLASDIKGMKEIKE